jgi:hypothetical protein
MSTSSTRSSVTSATTSILDTLPPHDYPLNTVEITTPLSDRLDGEDVSGEALAKPLWGICMREVRIQEPGVRIKVPVTRERVPVLNSGF